MKAQLVGMPASTHRRLKGDLEAWSSSLKPEIVVEATPSRDNHRPVLAEAELNDIHAKVAAGFVHLLVVPTRHWKLVTSEFAFDCRISLLRFSDQFVDVSWGMLEELLVKALDFEKRWLAKIAPTDVRHALLLPPPSFDVVGNLRNFWRQCDVYSDTALIGKAHDLLQQVKAQHLRKKESHGHCWVDEKDRQFAFDHARHGLSLEERQGKRRFRFCFELPSGFHFDVQAVSGQEFVVPDRFGVLHKGTHLNIDPWGSIR